MLFWGGMREPAIPTDLEFPVFLPLAITMLVLMLLGIFVETKFLKMKLNIPLIAIMFSLFVVNLVNILITPLENTIEYVYLDTPGSVLVSIPNEYKIIYIFCYALLLLHIYYAISYLTSRVSFKKQFIWICSIVVVAGLFFVIYSYITEAETYRLFIENMGTVLRAYNPQSLTNNTNSYAAIILGSAFCSYGLYAATNKHIFWVIGLFFCVNVIFPMSRICLVLSLALTVMIFAYKMIISWKGHAFRNLNLIFIVVFLLGLFGLMALNVTEMKEYIKNVVFTNDSSINSRTPLWNAAIDMTRGYHRIIGNGHGYFNTAFATVINNGIKFPHNLYVQTYGALGILGITCVGLLICYALYKAIRLYKNNREASLISIIGLITITIYYLVEG